MILEVTRINQAKRTIISGLFRLTVKPTVYRATMNEGASDSRFALLILFVDDMPMKGLAIVVGTPI